MITHPSLMIIMFFILNIAFTIIFVFFVIKRSGGIGVKNEFIDKISDYFKMEVKGGEPFFSNIQLLSFIKRPIYLEKMEKGHIFKFFHYSKGSGKNKTTYSSIRLYFQNVNKFSLCIQKEGVFAKIGKMFGMQDITVGDSTIDKMFLIKANNPSFVLNNFFITDIKNRLITLYETHDAKGIIKIENDYIAFDEIGYVNNAKKTERMIHAGDLVLSIFQLFQ